LPLQENSRSDIQSRTAKKHTPVASKKSHGPELMLEVAEERVIALCNLA
jgi:hypothetical protein